MSARHSVAWLSLVFLIASSWYLYTNRYFFRLIPIPLGLAEVINTQSFILPNVQVAEHKGVAPLTGHDLRSEDGLRAVLNEIQQISPFEGSRSFIVDGKSNFQQWLSNLSTQPFLCTDASLLFVNVAWKQGLTARWWHLFEPGWPEGQGHTVAEFFNPLLKQWQLVDPQHAAILRGKDGKPVDMLFVLRAYAAGKQNDIIVDYGTFDKRMRGGARGATVEEYFFKAGLLKTPVLQLRLPTWFADYPTKLGFSGHFVIGYPIVMNEWTHDPRTLLTKLAALIAMISGVVFLYIVARNLSRTT